jgi:hypothetical protein
MAHHLALRRGAFLGPLLLLTGINFSAAPARAADAGPVVAYFNKTSFTIPFQVDEGDRRIQQVRLNVSVDDGRTYQYVASALPADRKFSYTATRDGWYWFAVQTQDTDGGKYPANLGGIQPGLKVCVDTLKPTIALRAVQPREGNVAVEWDIKDENLDEKTMRLSYRPAGGTTWTALDVQPLTRAQFGWNAEGSASYEVRLQVSDKAQNYAEALTTVRPPAASRNINTPVDSNRAAVIHVPKRSFQLDYTIENVGPSAVKNVEVWETRDTRSWRRYSDDAKDKGPYTVTVRAEGRYGYTLIPRSGVGLSEKPPQVGDQPQIWIEVDETKPVVRLISVDVGRGADSGKLKITWNALDKHLKAQPITILYSQTAEGPWTELAGKLENTRSYVASSEGLPFEFFLRVEASDEAGNVGSDQTRATVKVDLKVPKISGVKVKALDAGSPSPE